MKMSDVFNLPMICEDGDGYLYSQDLRYSIQFDDTDLGMMKQKIYVSTAINNHDKLVEALKTTANELNSYIEAENERLKANICCTDLDDPDYHDQQTVHDAFVLLNEINKYGGSDD